MKPLIGLTPIVDAGRDSLWMLPGYMRGLEAVGGIGMMLPLTDDAAMLKDIVDRVDGILLTGGWLMQDYSSAKNLQIIYIWTAMLR